MKILKKTAACAVSLLLPFSCISWASPVLAAETAPNTAVNDYYPIDNSSEDIPSFSEYYDLNSSQPVPESEIVLRGADAVSAENGIFSTGSYGTDGDMRDGVLIWESSGGTVTYDIDVPESGRYCLGISYFPIESNSPAIELSMKIDGKIPYDTASRITLDRVWVNSSEITEDSRGNQIRPSQIQKGMWQDTLVGDIDGLFGEPLFFCLEKGSHSITFTSERAEFAIEQLRFCPPEEIPSYSEYKNSLPVGGSSSEPRIIRIEGENAAFKSDPTLCPAADNSSYLLSPSDPIKVVYNTLGGGSWKKALQSAEWIIPAEDIGSGGMFRIGIKAKQDQMRGFCSNRRIYIDGKVLCRELDDVKFPYDTDWELVTPKTDDNEDIYVYLEGGYDHTIKLECVPGEIGEPMRKLEDIVSQLNTYYRRIMMITGPAPDKYTDYYVHEKIPDIVESFTRISAELRATQQAIEAISDSKGSEAAALENMAVILDKCTKKPLRIPDYLTQIKDSTASLSAWMRDYRDQPLDIDYIELASEGAEFTSCKESLGSSLSFGLKSFAGSFFEDYTTLSDVTGEDALEVWVALGRDQAQVIKELTENEFMQEYNIPVSVNLVVGGVMEASLAGKGPDVALFLGGEFPVNLAARDMIVDVSQYPDFSEVTKNFQKNAMTPYQYNGGTYGLPISQTFPMMFCRTDILSELGINSPPETWQELKDILPALQRNYMSVGLILPPANISPATEAGHTFAMMMLQKGKNYYNSDLTASTFDSVEAVQSFEEWTDLYTKYSFSQTYDAFSRFRTGEYPIVISNYTFFNQLTAAAPEIKGAWDICPVPGTMREDGTISHAANSTGSGAVIFNKTKNKENAWKYIKWFTETDTQTEFASQTEGLLGILGRFDTANTEALKQLSWSDRELERLFAQRDELEEIPIIPSSYAVTRNIMNAFRETVNLKSNPRDTLIWYNRDINDEIERKRKDLGQ